MQSKGYFIILRFLNYNIYLIQYAHKLAIYAIDTTHME